MSYKPKGNNIHYRIKFFIVKMFPKRTYIDTTADKARHFQLSQNNKLICEFTDLKNAIEKIIEMEGQNHELSNLLENIYYVQNPTAMFTTTGITYTQKHGVIIEQKFRV
jgi:hypothetical protein